MTPTIGFPLFLAVTLVFLAGVVLSGRAARRRVHLPCVALAVASLGVTIYFAEKLGELYDLEAAGTIYPVHLFFAKLTVVAYLAPLVTGPMTIKRAEHLPKHRLAAYCVLVLTVVTAVTGTLMMLGSERL